MRACSTYRKNGSHITPFMAGAVKREGRFSKEGIKNKIRDFSAANDPFDIVFTHGRYGDYGHKTHKLIHHIVKEPKLKNTYNFALSSSANTEEIPLSKRSLQVKRQALRIYQKGSQKTNLEKLKKLVVRSVFSETEYFKRAN